MYRLLPDVVKAGFIRARQRRLAITTWDEFHAGRPAAGSVAIVGNAAYLGRLDQGDVIDGHDLVIRLNNFRTVGFEQQVGSRCDVFLTNFFTDIRFDRPELIAVPHLVASVPNALRRRRQAHLHHRHGEHIAAGLERLDRRRAFVPSAAAFASASAACGAVPSTGMMALRFVLEHVPFRRLFVTGYSFFAEPAGVTHYFHGPASPGTRHDFTRERSLAAAALLPLMRAGRAACDPLLRADLERAA